MSRNRTSSGKAYDMSKVRTSSGKVHDLSRRCDGELLHLAEYLEDYCREFEAAGEVMAYRVMIQELGGKQCKDRLCCVTPRR
ncbi:hypothetical protein ABT154_21450 [Streptomyces sp. NPDC001728]|uniref:hypothetical protein n=1 Tax=Streptomyces sp. NPDC001728 TaxID=3154396 RepID=UPI0033230AAF